jgi:hypothetical protein
MESMSLDDEVSKRLENGVEEPETWERVTPRVRDWI